MKPKYNTNGNHEGHKRHEGLRKTFDALVCGGAQAFVNATACRPRGTLISYAHLPSTYVLGYGLPRPGALVRGTARCMVFASSEPSGARSTDGCHLCGTHLLQRLL